MSDPKTTTPSDTEARMREILRQCSNEMGSTLVSLDSLFGSRQLRIVIEAMLRARNEAIEECAKICEQQQRVFLSPQYAVDQPLSSVRERFACGQCATAIRQLKTTKAKDNE